MRFFWPFGRSVFANSFFLPLRSERFLPTETELPARILPEPEPELVLSLFRVNLSFHTRLCALPSSPLLHSITSLTALQFYSCSYKNHPDISPSAAASSSVVECIKGGADFLVEQVEHCFLLWSINIIQLINLLVCVVNGRFYIFIYITYTDQV